MTLRRTVPPVLLIIALGSTIALVGGQTAGAAGAAPVTVVSPLEGFLPDLGGGGIVLAGSQHDTISHNVVTDNRGNTLFSGGIVLITNTLPNPDGSFDVSKDNLVTLNRLSGNGPADIVTDAASTPNVVVGNRCDTSLPDVLCSF